MFNIGDKLTKENYTQGAIWCRKNNATINEINNEYVICAIPEPTQEELNQARIAELKQNLAKADFWGQKYLDGEYTEEEWEVKKATRKAWRQELRELEGE